MTQVVQKATDDSIVYGYGMKAKMEFRLGVWLILMVMDELAEHTSLNPPEP
ncbi:hypothetical protein [Bacillus marinisedimentorum]|uniref:hypothetical protein n=1 Tax=Bacillus marinisedimentorum TaxID=1821260 RepID=UPI0012FF5C41|nr:hypothetical protein [Bacillus marinisedimentorum]